MKTFISYIFCEIVYLAEYLVGQTLALRGVNRDNIYPLISHAVIFGSIFVVLFSNYIFGQIAFLVKMRQAK